MVQLSNTGEAELAFCLVKPKRAALLGFPLLRRRCRPPPPTLLRLRPRAPRRAPPPSSLPARPPRRLPERGDRGAISPPSSASPSRSPPLAAAGLRHRALPAWCWRRRRPSLPRARCHGSGGGVPRRCSSVNGDSGSGGCSWRRSSGWPRGGGAAPWRRAGAVDGGGALPAQIWALLGPIWVWAGLTRSRLRGVVEMAARLLQLGDGCFTSPFWARPGLEGLVRSPCRVRSVTADGGGGCLLRRGCPRCRSSFPAAPSRPRRSRFDDHGEAAVMMASPWWRTFVGGLSGGACRTVRGCGCLADGRNPGRLAGTDAVTPVGAIVPS
nr:uncharacterized protein LOC123497031 isoform X1 [Aegilops tauschii subsp. strangulata]XP_045088736.1 uncharacterized protein LOC123497031 isoform X2 [Aegilops tauschii subsp. strangulata]